MERQVKVNGQVIVLADTEPLYHHGYDQWRLINTGETWNVDGSEAAVCYNADIAEAQGEITVLAPTFGDTKDYRIQFYEKEDIQVVECWKDGKSTIHTIVNDIDTALDQNQIKYWLDNNKNGQPFMVVWERGVGYVQSCGTAAIALHKHTGQNTIRCHGGEYTIEHDALYTRKLKAKYVENISWKR